jgi:hypothetical protein
MTSYSPNLEKVELEKRWSNAPFPPGTCSHLCVMTSHSPNLEEAEFEKRYSNAPFWHLLPLFFHRKKWEQVPARCLAPAPTCFYVPFLFGQQF